MKGTKFTFAGEQWTLLRTNHRLFFSGESTGFIPVEVSAIADHQRRVVRVRNFRKWIKNHDALFCIYRHVVRHPDFSSELLTKGDGKNFPHREEFDALALERQEFAE